MASLGKTQGYMAKIGLDLSDIDKQIKTLQTELKQVDKALANDADNAVLLNQKYTILNETIKALNDKFTALSGASDKVDKAFAAGQIQDTDFRAYQRAIEETKISISQLTAEQQGNNKEMEQAGDAAKVAANDINTIPPAANSASDAIRDINDQIADWTSDIAAFGEKALGVLKTVATDCIEVGKQFETSMSKVAATMGVDTMSEDYQQLEQAAKDFGATTRYTASEVAEALNYMALAGYNTQRSIETLPQLLNLAQAGGMDFARASEMLTNSANALGLSTNEIAAYIDKMAVTARSSGTNVEQLGEAILTVGGTARNMAGGVTEMDTVLGILADNGIKAAEGGTKLRNVLVKMAKPTKGTYKLLDELNMSFYDMEGNLRPLPELFTEMSQKMEELQLTTEQRNNLIAGAFNQRDIAAINALLNTSAERWDELSSKINKANGASEQMAQTMNDNLQGALYQLKSAKEAVEIEIYQKMQEPLAKIVNLTADTVRGINAVFEDDAVGKEFTNAFNQIASTIQEQMPNIINLFKQFAEKIVPRLGDLTSEIIELTGDKVLPAMINGFEWIIDHGAAVENTIKLIIGAMVVDKVGRFSEGIYNVAKGIGNLSTSLTNLATNAPAATSAVAGLEGAGNAAAAGATAAATAMSGILAVAAVAAAGIITLANALDDAGEAARRSTPYLNGFTDAANNAWDRYVQITSGENTQSSTQLSDQIKKDNDQLEIALKERENYAQKLNELNNTVLEWQDGESEYDFQRRKESLEEDKQYTQQKILEYDREIEALRNAIYEETKLRDQRIEEEQKADKQAAENARINNSQKIYSQKKASEAEQNLIVEENKKLERLNQRKDYLEDRLRTHKYADAEERKKDAESLSNALAEIDEITQKQTDRRLKQQQEEEAALRAQEEADAESFADYLEYQEELWDKKYHWDKENYKEYWEEKEKFLEENKVDTKEWNQAWNETEKKLGKIDTNTQKEIDKNIKDAETKIKNALDSYKNKLKLAVAQGNMTEYEANEALGQYIAKNLSRGTDLYNKEYTDYLNTKKSFDDKLVKEEEDKYKDNKKKQEELIKKKFEDLEIQANNEGWSDKKLLKAKYKVLEQYKTDNEIYLEVYEDTLQDLTKKESEINKKEREEREKQQKKDNEENIKSWQNLQKERKKVMESAQKEAEDILKKYYTSNRDEIAKYAQSSKTVTDVNGKERLVFTDYSKKLQELKVYQKNLSKLESMNLSEEHLNEIFSMDLDTRMKYISELVNMTGSQRAKYLSDYNAYQKTAGAVANKEITFQSDEIKAEIKEKYDSLIEDATFSGSAAAKAYAKAWNDAIKGTKLEGLDLLPSEITASSNAYAQGIATTVDTANKLMDTVNGLLGTTINVNIDNKKTVYGTLLEYTKKMQNAAAK